MNEDYYHEKKDKRRDFILGLFINIGIAFGAGSLYIIPFLILTLIDSSVKKTIAISIIVILTAIVEYVLIKRYLKKQRYIAIGMIVAIVAPLLILGTCSSLLFHS